MRRAGFAVAVAAAWLLLLGWAAGVDWREPLLPATVQPFSSADFRAVFGSGAATANGLRVTAAADDFSALQSIPLPSIAAQDYPILRYRFADFPRTLELTLVFRTAEAPDDVQTLSVPWPGDGESTVDLSRVDAWRGTIVELGFDQSATPLLVPPERGFRPFDLLGAELWSPSWRGRLAALATDWFGTWPWTQRSVHALGRDSDAPRAMSVVLVAALAALAVLVLGTSVLGWRGPRLRGGAVAIVFIAWIGLDAVWQAGLFGRLLATRALYADVAPADRARIVGDTDVQKAAESIGAAIGDVPPPTRILVLGGSGYTLLRLMWHLLPRNVGALVLSLPYAASLPDGAILVFYDSDAWYRDPALRALLAASDRLGAPGAMHQSGFEESRVVLFRYHHAR